VKEIYEQCMELAMSEAQKSISEDERIHPKVGVVVVKNDQIIAVAHRGETGRGNHAEFGELEGKLEDAVVAGATVYTTLEPCTTRGHPKVACAHRSLSTSSER
jgi:pyrimidine deaminase RibD-like protein